MFIHKQCAWLCRISGIPYHSPNVRDSGLDARRLLSDRALWQSRHGCFAPIRFFVDVPNLDKYSVILHLRDPRDVLVSMYFSYCFIHPGEVAANSGYRRRVADEGIDAFVLNKVSDRSAMYRGDYGTGGHVEDLVGNLPKRYEAYIDRLLGKPNVIFVRYEEMVTDYRSWLEKFIAPFPLENRGRVVEELVAMSPELFPRRTQDVMSHVRHVTPGDYREKLKPSTIRELNAVFGDVLDVLGYER